MTSGPGGGGRFSVPESILLPTIGSYICGQFEQGVPMNGLVALLRSGDVGYVQQATITTVAPIASAPPNVPATPPASMFTLGFIELLLASLAVLVVGGLLVARNRRASAI